MTSTAATVCIDCVKSGTPLVFVPSPPSDDDTVETTGLSIIAHRQLLIRKYVAVADLLKVVGVPPSISLNDVSPTQPVLDALKKNVSRYLRQHFSVGQDLLNRLKRYVAAGWAKLFSRESETGELLQMWCVIIAPPMEDAMYLAPLLGQGIVMTDDTYNLVGYFNRLNFFASVSPIADAGGATMPFMTMLFLTGSGVVGDMAAALSFARTFLHEKRMALHVKRAAAHAAHETAVTALLPAGRREALFAAAAAATVDAASRNSFCADFRQVEIILIARFQRRK